MEDTLISFGNAVKTLARTADTATVGHHGILFGDEARRDLVGDYFLKNCYFGARRGVGVDMMLNHGIPLSNKPEMKAYADILLPPVIKTELDDDGLLYQTVLSLNDAYQKKIFRMIDDGLLSSSTGALNHVVKRLNNAKTGGIERWVIGEISFTPTPCEPRLGRVASIKSLMGADVYEEDAMRAAVKTLTDTSFSLNVPLELDDEELEGGGGEPEEGAASVKITAGYPPKTVAEFQEGQAPVYGDEIKWSESDHDRADNGEFTSGSQHGSIHRAATRAGLSREATAALHRAHEEGRITTPEHLRNVLRTARETARTTGGSVTAAHINGASETDGHPNPPSPHQLHARKAIAAIKRALDSKGVKDFKEHTAAALSAVKKAIETADDKTQGALKKVSKLIESASDSFEGASGKLQKEGEAQLRTAVSQANALIAQSGSAKSWGDDWDIDALDLDDTPETKNLDEVLSAIQHEGLRLREQAELVLAANDALKSRFNDVIELRCVKGGRVLSQDNHACFSAWCDDLERLAREMREKLDLHAPQSQQDDADESEVQQGNLTRIAAREVLMLKSDFLRIQSHAQAQAA